MVRFSNFTQLYARGESAQKTEEFEYDESDWKKPGSIFDKYKAEGKIDGRFDNRWWHFYYLSRVLNDDNRLELSEKYLKQAINDRPNDNSRARKYGTHFIDYYPHRELGVVYYKQGKYSEAIEEFETSIKSESTKTAEQYLEMAEKKVKNNKAEELELEVKPEAEIGAKSDIEKDIEKMDISKKQKNKLRSELPKLSADKLNDMKSIISIITRQNLGGRTSDYFIDRAVESNWDSEEFKKNITTDAENYTSGKPVDRKINSAVFDAIRMLGVLK